MGLAPPALGSYSCAYYTRSNYTSLVSSLARPVNISTGFSLQDRAMARSKKKQRMYVYSAENQVAEVEGIQDSTFKDQIKATSDFSRLYNKYRRRALTARAAFSIR